MTDQDKPPTPSKRTLRKEAKDKKSEAAAEPIAALPAASIDALANAVASIESAKAEAAPAAAAAEVRPLQPAAASAAQAALQAAVEGSLQMAAKAAPPEARAAAPVRAADKKTVGRLTAFRTTTLPRLTHYAAYGLALTMAVTAGWAGNKYLASDRDGASALAFSIGQSQAETRRIAEDLRALKESVVGLNKGAVRNVQAPASSDDLKAMKASLAALNEGLERLKQDTGGRLTQLTTQLDRVEKSGGDTARITPLVDRLDRIERQTATFSTLVTGSISQQSPASQAQEQTRPQSQVQSQVQNQVQGQAQAQVQVAKAEEAKPDPKQQRLDGFVLREIFDGVALVETRRGIIEVAPGQNIAGIGRIEKFERRGRQWVVVTDKGFIPSAQ